MSILAVALVLAAQQAGPPEERRVLVPPRGERAPASAWRAITETDLFRFVWIGDPQISPDGADAQK